MNLNPFVFKYKKYYNCPLATMLSAILAALEKVFFIFSIMIILVIIFEDVSNWDEALIGAVVMIVISIVLRIYKFRWSDKLAEKEIKKNS